MIHRTLIFPLHRIILFDNKTHFLMVGVAQLVEHLVVAQVVVGSSPITHPIRNQDHCRTLRCNGLIV